MIFGGINKNQYIGELQNFPLKTNKYWAINIVELSYDGSSTKVKPNINAAVDTGT